VVVICTAGDGPKVNPNFLGPEYSGEGRCCRMDRMKPGTEVYGIMPATAHSHERTRSESASISPTQARSQKRVDEGDDVM
jgi:hypothetical protein